MTVQYRQADDIERPNHTWVQTMSGSRQIAGKNKKNAAARRRRSYQTAKTSSRPIFILDPLWAALPQPTARVTPSPRTVCVLARVGPRSP